jgi:hypothetical protein
MLLKKRILELHIRLALCHRDVVSHDVHNGDGLKIRKAAESMLMSVDINAHHSLITNECNVPTNERISILKLPRPIYELIFSDKY